MPAPRPGSRSRERSDEPRGGRPAAAWTTTGTQRDIASRPVGGLAPAELADRFGSPLYVYDLDVVERQVAILRAALPARVELAYAVKANPALAVVDFIGRLGLGADVASGGELATALRAGIAADRIVMTGPGKRDDELGAAVSAGIRAVTVESPGELARLERIAANAGRVQPVLLRAAVSEHARLERVRLVGDDGAGKFGMDAADLADSARRAVSSAHLELLGLHAFGASNILDAGDLVAHVAATVRAARRLALSAGTTLRLIDAGGGLASRTNRTRNRSTWCASAPGLAEITRDWDTIRSYPTPGSCSSLGASWSDQPARTSRASSIARPSMARSSSSSMAGSITCCAQRSSARSIGCARSRPVAKVRTARQRAGGRMVPVTVAGALCSGLDVFSQSAVMTPPEVGDLVAVLDVGAYGFTEIDAALPVASDPGRGCRPRRARRR